MLGLLGLDNFFFSWDWSLLCHSLLFPPSSVYLSWSLSLCMPLLATHIWERKIGANGSKRWVEAFAGKFRAQTPNGYHFDLPCLFWSHCHSTISQTDWYIIWSRLSRSVIGCPLKLKDNICSLLVACVDVDHSAMVASWCGGCARLLSWKGILK